MESSTSINQLLKQRNAELAVINSVQVGLAKALDLQVIYDLVGNQIRDVFDAQAVMITTFNTVEETEQFNFMIEKGIRYYPKERKYDRLRKHLVDTGQKIIIETTDDFFKWFAKGTNIGGTEPMKSGVFMPLVIGEKIKGYISLQNVDHENAFTESDVSLLQTLANSMSVSLENARLFDETNRLLKETELRNSELAVINSVQDGLAKELDLQSIYEMVGNQIREVFNAQVVIIATFDHAAKLDYMKYVIEKGERFYPGPRPYDKIRKAIIKTSQKLVFNTIPEVITWIGAENAIEGENMKSGIFMPLINGMKVNGYISLQNVDMENAFSVSDISLLQTLANSMSVALENARLFDETHRLLKETEQRTAELAIINSVQEELAKELEINGIYEVVGEKMREIFVGQVIDIVSYDKVNNSIEDVYAFENGDRTLLGKREPNGFRKHIINSKQTLLINNDKEKASDQYNNSVLIGQGSKSIILVPMLVADEIIGIISLQNLEKENAFTDSDVKLLNTFSNCLSVAIEKAQLFNETTRLLAETEQRNNELAVINSVQDGLVQEMDMTEIYNLVGDRVSNVLQTNSFIIRTFDHEINQEKIEYAIENGERFYVDSRPIMWANRLIIKSKESLIINEKYKEFSIEQGETGRAFGELPKSAIFIPIILNEQVVGSVSWQNISKEHAFSESDIRLLNTLTNSMCVALENAQLFNETTRLLAETKQQNEELAVINSVQDGLVREMDLKGIYSLVGDRICKVINCTSFVIRTFDHENGLEIWEYSIEHNERLYIKPKPLIWANELLIKTKKPIIINENYAEISAKYSQNIIGMGAGSPKSAIFIPMIVGEKVVGSVSLQDIENEHAFTESDIRLLNTLTNSMSVALENAQLFNETVRLLSETKQRATEMETVNQISSALVSQLEIDALIHLVGENMKSTFKADIVYVALHDRKTDMIHFPYVYGEELSSRKFGDRITEQIINSKEPLLVNENLQEVSDTLHIERKGKLAESLISVPIISRNVAIGVISVQSTQKGNKFNTNDQRLLTTIASNVGIAIHNAEAYQELQETLTELKSAQEQLVQQEKLASLGQLAAGIAHEIKNPLNFVNNFSELNSELIDEMNLEIVNGNYKEAKDLAEDIKGNQEKITHHGKRADAIVKSMLQHSRSSTGTKELTDINALSDEYLRLAYHGLRAKDKSFNATMKTDFDTNIKFINVVPQDIGRVILNLITNSFYAIDEKKKQLGKDFEPTLSISTKKVNGKIEIQVRDNGNGIPQKLLDKVFQPFFTTKPTGEGTGLGLSLSYDIIKAHGGELKIETKETEFTQITITLPE